MKYLALFSFLTVSITASAQTSPPKTFIWKLHVHNGETWQRKYSLRSRFTQQYLSHGKITRVERTIQETANYKTQVLEVHPTYILTRLTYKPFIKNSIIKVDGKVVNEPKLPDIAWGEISFLVKCAPDSRIIDITGLDKAVALEQKEIEAVTKDPVKRAALRRLLPSSSVLKRKQLQNNRFVLPRTPLSVGDSYPEQILIPDLNAFDISLKGKRTLDSFDGKRAIFDEANRLFLPLVQVHAWNEKSGKSATKSFVALKGTQTGKTTVDVKSGIVRTSDVKQTINGQYILVDGTGHKRTDSITATSYITFSTV